MSKFQDSLAYRNCNPLNIRFSKDTNWMGSKLKSSKGFVVFATFSFGYRAAVMILRSYRKRGIKTMGAIIESWAPRSENDTEAYIANVSRLTGIDPDKPLGIPKESPSVWMMVAVAMAIQENGITSIDYFAMLRGWELLQQ
jgi:hypothetical protein